MRLTLRTLLAYLDEVLEPGDSEELETKIRESDFASGLVHRIRSAMSRLRLSCPEPLARGLVEDANSVGEYIDSTLPEDRLADFERGCLESDMHLSEVASCHQIVTWVVREPAQVTPGMRERIRQLGGARFKMQEGGYQRVDEALANLDDPDTSWKGGDRPNGSVTKERPDYMSAGRKKSMAPWIVAALAGFLVTVGFLIGTAGNGNKVAQTDTITPPPGAIDMATDQLDAAAAQRDSGFVGTADPDADADMPAGEPSLSGQGRLEEAAMPVETPTDDGLDPGPSEPPSLPSDDRMDDRATLEVADSSLAEADGAVDSAVDMSAANAVTGSEVALPEPAAPLATDLAADTTADPADPAETAAAAADMADNVAAAATDTPPVTEDAPAPDSEVVATPPEVEAGRYISDREVMAYWDSESGMWLRLEPRSTLKMGARMRVPTAFRPQLLLGNGVQVTFAGRSELTLEQPAAGNSPIIRLNYGRALFVTLGNDADRVAVMAGGQPFEVIFGDQEAEFAVEVAKLMTPGQDPTTVPRQQTVRVWATSGRIGLRPPGQETRAIEAGQQWRSVDNQPAELTDVEQMPDWIDGAQLSDIDRTALHKVEPMLPVDRSLTLSLSEAAESRRQEVRSLAARCLASLERFEPLTAALSDPKQHPSWQAQFHELQAAVARNAETARRVQEALQTTAGPDADKLYRMLWGYSKAQLDEGAALELVDEMENASLARRVLAFQNLHAATQKTLYYRPEKPPARRQESTNQWRRQISEGQISVQPTPSVSSND